MSLIYGTGLDTPQAEPGTHVLIIGVGGPRIARAMRPGAVHSAVEFAEWLIEHYRNGSAPLASIRMLAYPAPGEIVRLKSLGSFSKLDVPSLNNVTDAMDEWAEASRRDTRNIAILYYVGYSVEDPADIGLLLAPPRGSKDKDRYISAQNIRSAMRGTGAGRQLLMFDVERLSLAGMPYVDAPLAVPLSMADTPAQTTIIASEPFLFGRRPRGENGTLFFQTLMKALNTTRRNKRGAVSVHRLTSQITADPALRGEAGAEPLAARLMLEQDFDLHFPGAAFDRKLATPPDVHTATTDQEEPDRNDEGATPFPPSREGNTDLISDEAEIEEDHLNRAVLAIGLARRLHRIWRRTNSDGHRTPASFAVHLDAPWGGGKTSFANFVGAVLNPKPQGASPAHFLRERYPDQDVGGLFLDDPPVTRADRERVFALPDSDRRPWIVVPFNAWLNEHCTPPWWTFFQTIRRHSFAAIAREGSHPWCANQRPDGIDWLRRKGHWAALVAREFWWRLTNPKVRTLLLTALLSAAALLALGYAGAVAEGPDPAKPEFGFAIRNYLGWMLAGLAGITGIWGFGALVTESILPGTDTLAERLSLGKGDPFERFRTHFDRTMRAVRRPVLVVIDDLDRCHPAFVVDLVRGIQTILASPRVVFLILGDRDWIERAFEAHHKDMANIEVGPEQSFGARFVEKAIQMSFILPALGETTRYDYVRRILFAGTDQTRQGNASLDPAAIERVRTLVATETAPGESASLDVAPLVDAAIEELKRSAGDEDVSEATRAQVTAVISETLAINAAVDERVEAAVRHELEPLAGLLPANPRQIKRIVNAITIYWAVALQRFGSEADAAFRFRLALWVTIMTEWPLSWRALATCPPIADCLAASEPLKALDKIDSAALPIERDAARAEIERIAADASLTALITGKGKTPHPALTAAEIARLAELTPIRARRRPATPPSQGGAQP